MQAARKLYARSMTEAQWQAKVIETAHTFGWTAFHNPDSRRITPGWPDLALTRPGEVIFPELKKETGELKPHQEHVLSLLASAGVECYVWRPCHWPDVFKRLSRKRTDPGQALDFGPRPDGRWAQITGAD